MIYSHDYARIHGLVRALLFDRQPIEQPLQLPTRDRHGLVRMLWPLKAPALQPAVIQPETVVIPAQDLQLVPLAVTEDEPLVRKWVAFEYNGDKG